MSAGAERGGNLERLVVNRQCRAGQHKIHKAAPPRDNNTTKRKLYDRSHGAGGRAPHRRRRGGPPSHRRGRRLGHFGPPHPAQARPVISLLGKALL